MEKMLIILRGLPGSGKTTFAKLLNTKAICSADDYVTHQGQYKWKPETVSLSHEWCQRKCRRFMQIDTSPVVIANTSTTEKELQPYLDLAKTCGYKVFSVVIENRHNGKNVHNVPEATLDKMSKRFEIKLI